MRDTDISIGGYFGLETSSKGSLYHDDALAVNTGRNALEFILRRNKFTKIHLPFYTCDVILQPIIKLNIEYTFYHLNDEFKPLISDYSHRDAILYNNYFGLNQKNIEKITSKYKNLIIDNAQAFFDKPHKQVSTFYSPRKFFGIPDGGFVYDCNKLLDNTIETDTSIDRLSHLLTRIESGAEIGYDLFKINEAKLENQPIKSMSNLTRTILEGVDFMYVKQSRLNNFYFLHENLKKTNKLSSFIEYSNITCPMIYPYLIDNGFKLREKLIKNKIYTAIYWPNVLEWVDKNTIEFELVNNLVCIPIDQRYNCLDLFYVLKYI